ncbi:hypothetical protein [Spiroplasma melliferum]|uniref:Uncharacterized protein n=2 Tax=Spiroplasma melliferum TaxID=2134 RepID=A0AAI9T2B1_SPIME|nr:hypothetical protein [Spiroplasma melliferum]KAI92012.1 hypothetical protein SPM_006635 [Spiroplasma melliferum KC3]KDN00118.1 hypothetical protein BK60_14715 [Neisseria gonorrhoeae]QCO23195.1 hypothetical protein SRED_003057 [Spiroplasma melliferum]QCO23216.1 hypothetical protein SRED_003078 [Spiroplasma melliferum]
MDLKKIQKLGIGILTIGIILMIVGLILIGSFKDELGINGFGYLRFFGTGMILGQTGVGLLKTGIVFAIILSPIVGAVGIILLGYSIYKKNK